MGRSRSRSRSRSYDRRRSRSASYDSRSPSPEEGYRVHVADLGIDPSKRDLERAFEKFGPLIEVWVARNPPCFAFIVYKYREDAEKALREMDGKPLSGGRIRCSLARPRTRGRRRRGFDPNLRCYTCGEKGHFSRDCAEIWRQRRRNRKSAKGGELGQGQDQEADQGHEEAGQDPDQEETDQDQDQEAAGKTGTRNLGQDHQSVTNARTLPPNPQGGAETSPKTEATGRARIKGVPHKETRSKFWTRSGPHTHGRDLGVPQGQKGHIGQKGHQGQKGQLGLELEVPGLIGTTTRRTEGAGQEDNVVIVIIFPVILSSDCCTVRKLSIYLLMIASIKIRKSKFFSL